MPIEAIRKVSDAYLYWDWYCNDTTLKVEQQYPGRFHSREHLDNTRYLRRSTEQELERRGLPVPSEDGMIVVRKD